MIYKTLHRKLKNIRNHIKTGGELKYFCRVGSSCSTRDTRRVTHNFWYVLQKATTKFETIAVKYIQEEFHRTIFKHTAT